MCSQNEECCLADNITIEELKQWVRATQTWGETAVCKWADDLAVFLDQHGMRNRKPFVRRWSTSSERDWASPFHKEILDHGFAILSSPTN